MFRGINSLNLDAKGRFAIPTKYRESLKSGCASQLVITVDPNDPCLFIYPAPEWQEIERKLMTLPTFDPAARRMQRLLVGHAAEVDMDGQGRILLPPPLREFAKLNKHAVLIGQGGRFELWDEERWNEARTGWLEESNLERDLPSELATLSI